MAFTTCLVLESILVTENADFRICLSACGIIAAIKMVLRSGMATMRRPHTRLW